MTKYTKPIIVRTRLMIHLNPEYDDDDEDR